jgi:hypothetical protein
LEGAIVNGAIGKYRVVSPTALLVLTVCIIAAVLFAAGVNSASAEAATGQHNLTIYSVPVLSQYINKADDRQRAVAHNPFNVDTAKLAPKDKGKGPFAGDTTLYTFTLYTSRSLTKKIGSAAYTCNYNFAQNALCTAYFELKGGTLLASGRILFTSRRFTLAVTGGTNKYFAANGEVAMAPVTTNMQRLSFVLLGS